MLRELEKKTFLVAISIVLLIPSLPVFSQNKKTFYIGLTHGLGNTFTRIDWRDENNRYNYLRGRIGVSASLGMELRYDLTEKLSFQTGAVYVNRGFRATYPENKDFGIFLILDRLGFKRRTSDIIFPLQCIGRVPINKNATLYATFTGGTALDLMVNPASQERVSYYDEFLSFTSSPDSADFTIYSFYHARPRLQAMLVLGVGMEKKIGNGCSVAFSLVSYTGFKKVSTGDFYFYDTPVYAPDLNSHHPFQTELPPQPPAEHDKIFSRNTSLMLQCDFFFAPKKWRKPAN